MEVLKLLQKSYHGKVKMIYIDPPYNTGNDFVYKDDYKDPLKNYLEITRQVDESGKKISTNSESSGRFHTNWLNMMYPRLKLARNLLRDSGVLFVSIDDKELYNLKKICDEIFGEGNFVGVFVINSSPSAIDYGHIAQMHDYVLFYAKKLEETSTNQLPEKGKKFKYDDEIGPFNLYPLYNGNVAFNPNTRPNLHYPFYLNPSNKINESFYEIGLEKKEGWVEVFPVVSRKDGIERVWRWGKKKARQELNKEIIGYKTNEGEFRVVQKTRLTGKVIRSLLLDKGVSSRRGTAEIDKIFSAKIFSFPKSVELLERLLSVGMDKEDIVIDFFSGSAPIAQAVLQLNAEDGGRRKFIMVQLPEPTDEKSEAHKAGYKNICEIGKERIRRAGEKIKAELQEKQSKQPSMLEDKKTVNPDDLDIGFKVFKLDSSNLKKWNPDYEHVEASLLDAIENFAAGREELDMVYEIMLKYGIDLTFPIEEFEVGGKMIYSVGYGALMICLDNEITTDVANEIVRLKNDLKPEVIRVVFKDNGFQDDSVKTNTKEILRNAGIDEIVSI